MKKFALIAAALCLACLVAAPAGALEITTDGYFRAQYLGGWNISMAKGSSNIPDGANSFGTLRLRVNGHIKVNDNLGIRTRFRALNALFGQDNGGSSNFDWERAWGYAKFDFGILEVGRMSGGAWGNAVFDNEGDADRVKFTAPVGPVSIIAIYQKTPELDGAYSSGFDGLETNDSDQDIPILGINYKAESFSTGLLTVYYSDKTKSDIGAGAYKREVWRMNPYFNGKFGPFGILAEADFYWGKGRDYYDSSLKDGDDKRWRANIEGSFDFGMGSAQLGYVYATGQDPDSNDVEGITLGDDWEKMYILTASTGPTSNTGALGTVGNWSSTGGNTSGISMFYGGATFNPMENLEVGGLLAYASADETPSGVDDSIGWEFDIWATYTIFDNLSNKLLFAYLSSDDYFKDTIGSSNYDGDVWAVQNEFKLAF